MIWNSPGCSGRTSGRLSSVCDVGKSVMRPVTASTISSSVTAMAYPGSHAGWREAGAAATFALPAVEAGAVAAGLAVCLLMTGVGTGAAVVAGVRAGGLSAFTGPSAGTDPGDPSSVAFSG